MKYADRLVPGEGQQPGFAWLAWLWAGAEEGFGGEEVSWLMLSWHRGWIFLPGSSWKADDSHLV